ncbi:hypothetical protein [Desulfofundulus kuznetsovii]|uniref:hypothetical protein n=1 Tax=Desulfofundulus kuznetsovii TaxID=58135 RepID=UPI00059B957F
MGVKVQVESKIRQNKLFFEKYIEVTPDIEQIIREHVSAKAEGGKYKEEGRAAVIWWNVQETGDERK